MRRDPFPGKLRVMNDEGTAADGASPAFYPEEHPLEAMADRNNIVIEKEDDNTESVTVSIQGNQTGPRESKERLVG